MKPNTTIIEKVKEFKNRFVNYEKGDTIVCAAKSLEHWITTTLHEVDRKARMETAKTIQEEVYGRLYDAQWVELATPTNFEAGKLNITAFDDLIKEKYLKEDHDQG